MVRSSNEVGGWDQGDPVSCGQAMYNFAKAIETARKSKEYDTSKWEKFLRKACDGVSDRILSKEWNPKSTAEGFYIAPLAIASDLFRDKRYKQAAEKAAGEFASRHLEMDGCYWGGTLDATCEDKEGSWAAPYILVAKSSQEGSLWRAAVSDGAIPSAEKGPNFL